MPENKLKNIWAIKVRWMNELRSCNFLLSYTYSYRLSYNPAALGNGGDPRQDMPEELMSKG